VNKGGINVALSKFKS